MKEHILEGLREQKVRWENLLDGLSEEAVLAPAYDSHGEYSVKDMIVHLWAWQQRTVARCEAAAGGGEPVFPHWPEGLQPESNEEDVPKINAWIHQTWRDKPWGQVVQDWKAGYQRFIDAVAEVSEVNLLEGGVYPWLYPFPLVWVAISSYNHHQEHYDKLRARLG